MKKQMQDAFPNFKSAYDKEDDGDVILKNERSPRPKDAATLILVRRDRASPRFLMGKRSGRHDFMPDKYVFPGGRVDAGDARAPIVGALKKSTENKLRKRSRRAPQAFPLTAIRETWEETGLIVGKAAEVSGKPPLAWQKYYAEGAAPCLKNFQFIGRAITPPYRPKRFDARFFMAIAEDVLIDERPPADGAELHDLQWVTLKEALDLNLPNVTRFMLAEINDRLNHPKSRKGAPFLRWSRGGYSADRL